MITPNRTYVQNRNVVRNGVSVSHENDNKGNTQNAVPIKYTSDKSNIQLNIGIGIKNQPITNIFRKSSVKSA
jgi:hypothetical protein